ncbi:MAG: hypothetical protein MI919_22280, partial [Holophagales bacterium]|nr:hypothetical protein [Holophagales bacterium]
MTMRSRRPETYFPPRPIAAVAILALLPWLVLLQPSPAPADDGASALQAFLEAVSTGDVDQILEAAEVSLHPDELERRGEEGLRQLARRLARFDG